MGKSTRLALFLICMFSIILSSCGSTDSSPSAFGRGNLWTWKSGSNTVDQTGTYGSIGVTDINNVPGARLNAISWIDVSNNMWLFGGYGYDSTGLGHLNDLWKFDSTNWTWISGSNIVSQHGIYSTPGSNVPGARELPVSWIDNSGNLWLFGGYGLDSTNTLGYLNDLWKFDVIALTWTWVSGSNTVNQTGNYGTKGVPAASNVPGARYGAVSWRDSNGNLWFFGGAGYDSTGTFGDLNDLWKFDGTNWTWVSGSNVVNQHGTYSTPGSNVPGARDSAVSWIDGSGHLWLFGGYGIDSVGTAGDLNDLWKFDGSNWTWVSGSNIVNQSGIYGTQGTPAASNVPGVRWSAVSWIDGSGYLWLFGGYGLDSVGMAGDLNDLWKFDGSNWTWVSGSNIVNQSGIYGPIKGLPLASTVPGARDSAVSWIDSSGRLWLFGGIGYDLNGTSDYLNDVWRYQP